MEEQKPGEVVQPQQQEAVVSQASATMPAGNEQPPFSPPVQQAEKPSLPFTNPTDSTPDQPIEGLISWEADEYIANEKNRQWYIAMAVGSVVIAVIVYFLNKDIITALLVLVALAGLAAFGARRPRRQQFIVAPEGIQVGRMFYSFADFRSVAVAEEKNGSSLVFVSLKRFVPAINVYVPQEYEESVINIVASILPVEPHTPDAVERFMIRIRF